MRTKWVASENISLMSVNFIRLITIGDMMETDEEFNDLNEDNFQFTPYIKRQKTGVIKKERNHASGKLHLDVSVEEIEHGVEFFQAITEDDLIVGVIHKCSCGKTSELRFQYSEGV